MMDQRLELLQLADACFPSGGFAFSNGLECLAKLGHVKNMDDFQQYLNCHLEQLTSAELPFLNSAYAEANFILAGWEAPSGEGFIQVAQEWDAWLFLPTQRRASLSQGQAWSRAMEATYEAPGLRDLRKQFQAHHLPLHFLMVFAFSLTAAKLPLMDCQNLLIHMALRDQLGAAVRLGLLGSLQAQKLHRKFIRIGAEYITLHQDWVHQNAVRTAPMIDLAQASHTHLYSKLFQS